MKIEHLAGKRHRLAVRAGLYAQKSNRRFKTNPWSGVRVRSPAPLLLVREVACRAASRLFFFCTGHRFVHYLSIVEEKSPFSLFWLVLTCCIFTVALIFIVFCRCEVENRGDCLSCSCICILKSVQIYICRCSDCRMP